MYQSLTTSLDVRLAQTSTPLLVSGSFAQLSRSGAVHAVRDAIVLPGEVVVPLAHEPAVDLEIGAREGTARPACTRERLRFLRAEVGLEDDFVGRLVAVHVDQLR